MCVLKVCGHITYLNSPKNHLAVVILPTGKNEIKQYLSLTDSLSDIEQCHPLGYPVVFGFTVYESFMSEQVTRQV